MSSFNRPPRPFEFPSYDEEADFAPPSAYAGGRRVVPSFGEFAPAYVPPAERSVEAWSEVQDEVRAPAPTHSWLALDLIPSWLRPFTLDANTRFTRTPDHFLRPREVATEIAAQIETETAPAPEISTRGWHFVLDPTDDEPAAPQAFAPEASAPRLDDPAAQADSEPEAVAEVPVETVVPAPELAGLDAPAPGIVAPEPADGGSPVEKAQVAAPDDRDVEMGDATAVQEQDLEFVTESLSLVAVEPDADEPVPPADVSGAVVPAEEPLPTHIEALGRLLVLGRAAVPPAPAVEQDLAPVEGAGEAPVGEDGADALELDDDLKDDGETVEDAEVEDDDLGDDAWGDGSEACDPEEVDADAEGDGLEDEDLLVASDDGADGAEGEDDTFDEEDEADDEDEDLLLADHDDETDADDAGDDAGDDEDAPACGHADLAGLPMLTEPSPALWRPYQQSISAHFLGAVAPLGFASAAPVAAPAPVASAEPGPVARPLPSALAAPEAAGEADGYELPPLDLLCEPPMVEPDYELSEEFLDQSSTMLQQVLRDFGVRGEIIDANPGPVVTLYEFEPAPGVKSSRVIGLSADIARSMSAVSARVAVVEGRNVIGIELPNRRRETVWLRELLSSHEFTEARPKLGLGLGKTIGGVPVIADLARMPHLLVAGTTGSGKSVAINTMILSLLYRHTPDACRLIMIDPKMLELSIYEGIPHLLTPVVTDPKKAIIALKWAVKEMEERYRKMSRLAVRNIDGFNARVKEAAEKGEVITRSVQVGFDKETGESLFEEQDMDLTPLPYIVVIVDEMADLMMVAGKEIEGAIQRLAQMARAAGIHLVMATQRPSVDVITGTIKANFPTRISFQVTSKIDSRTILGEMGAETLLGQGDMLFMAGGGRIMRVHGPFVSDGEVEKVVAFLKAQGKPDYLDDVILDETAEVEDDDEAVFDRSGLGEAGGDLYEQAIAIVMRDRKASTSYIQRRLQVGYNKAASLMERMETEGIVGPANHAGKREILTFTRPG
ncbi:DNA translocase FtsK [Xanthobacter autotrophicus]|uniref:DNA translocase FtsK n=1 Tax=Xanthobacter TaxID=279 RepID=UPI0024ABD757|nr:DNA translocase FtsK [Xanthobacter autotrophicus]MDI4664402.1 DNA translocase FtsK [Xanthobacter autotrophicus]